MKILVIGATGLIGTVVVNRLEASHEVVRVGHSGGDHQVDITSTASIEALFNALRPFDAVVSTAGLARFGALADLSEGDFRVGLDHKLMGQVNLVRVGQHLINDGGSFTLTSGVLSRKPIPGSSAIALVNAGLEGFARAAALELPRGIRVNVVSPVFAKETMEMMGMDSSTGVPAAAFAAAYAESVEGRRNGEVLDVLDYR